MIVGNGAGPFGQEIRPISKGSPISGGSRAPSLWLMSHRRVSPVLVF